MDLWDWGKSSVLQRFWENQNGHKLFAGVIVPVINKKRKMLILSSKTFVEHQVNEYDPRGESGT